MMLNFVSSGLFESKAQTLVNTVNTVGVMGKGIAAEFKRQYPTLYEEYRQRCDSGRFEPGTSWLWKGDDRWVLNFATKKHWRKPSKVSYIQSGLEEFRANFEYWGIREISFPKLGCGNGGLDREEVRALMVKYLSGLPITIYVHDFDKGTELPEHEIDLFDFQRAPENFNEFLSDIVEIIEKNNGELNALRLPATFKVEVNKSFGEDGEFALNLYTEKCAEPVVIGGEDLFQFWLKMSDGYASRSDLPELAWDNALAVFSIIEKLPYARVLRLKNNRHRFRLGAEMRSPPHHVEPVKIHPR